MTRLPLEYRLATERDVPAVTDLCQEFHGFSFQRNVPFDWDIMGDWVSDRVSDTGSLVAGACVSIIGLIMIRTGRSGRTLCMIGRLMRQMRFGILL